MASNRNGCVVAAESGTDDFTARGEKVREELGAYLEKLEKDGLRFEEQRARILAREAVKAEKGLATAG
ncbi:hypothetical protein ACFYTS_35580 [Nocardia sp. NPDC004151]|uniref:hypothetical protein n=2 Tax=Nocardia TaxID=1817 RepID=UPI003696BBF1